MKLLRGELFGEGLRNHTVAGFSLSERLYPPFFETPKHSHETALLCFVINGGYTETYESKTRSCRAFNLLFHPRHEQHEEQFHSSGGRSLIVEIEQKWLQRLEDYRPLGGTPGAFCGGIFPALGARLYREFLMSDNLSPLIVEGLILQILGEAPRHSPETRPARIPPWLERLKKIARERFSERLRHEELAAAVGVHPVHMAQMFQRHYGCTLGDYIRRLRIEFACGQLAGTEAPLAEVALAAGFCDQSHFTRTFRRMVGVAPSQYRRARR